MSNTQTLVKVNQQDIHKLKFTNLEITQIIASTSGDLKSITLRDRLTGEMINFTQSPYSDFALYQEKPKEYKTVFRLTATLAGAKVTQDFESHHEAVTFANNNHLGDIVVTEEKVEKE